MRIVNLDDTEQNVDWLRIVERQNPRNEPYLKKTLCKTIANFIEKQEKTKVYIKPGEQAPEGMNLQRGSRGGIFYYPARTSDDIQLYAEQNKSVLRNALSDWRGAQQEYWSIPNNKKAEDITLSVKLFDQIVEEAGWPGVSTLFMGTDGYIDAAASYHRGPDDPYKTIVLDWLATSPRNIMRDKVSGAGSMMLLTIFRKALESGNEGVYVHPADNARNFYEAIGFSGLEQMLIRKSGMIKFIKIMEEKY